MPTYVYACRQCEDRTEVVQKMSDAPFRECGACGGELRRVLFPPAVVYKGSGFYTTDYKNGGRKSGSEECAVASGKDGAAAPCANGKCEAATAGKSEAATAGKSEATPAGAS